MKKVWPWSLKRTGVMMVLCGMLFDGSSLFAAGDAVTCGTDFSGEGGSEPWGFKAAGSTAEVTSDTAGGNKTPKLLFTIRDQKGSRSASKTFTPPIAAETVSISFEWYPGIINDKGQNKDENSGEISFTDNNRKTLFTVRYTHNGNICWAIAKRPATGTAFTKSDVWYAVNIVVDVKNSTLKGCITDKVSGAAEAVDAQLRNSDFSGVLDKMTITGSRTSGNNITWQTYIDAVNISYKPIPDKAVTAVDPIPYKRLYVNSAGADTASLQLPSAVSVKLADGTAAMVPVTAWKAAGTEWNPAEAGVYTFEGTLGTSDAAVNPLGRTAVQYVYNRLPVPESQRGTEWLDRSVTAVKADKGIFVSWRLRADEYTKAITFMVYRNGKKVTKKAVAVTNVLDPDGKAGDEYKVVTLENSRQIETAAVKAVAEDYLSIIVQKPEPGVTLDGRTSVYHMNDASVGDLDGDGQYEIIVKWYPENAVDSSLSALTAPTLFDAYKLDGTLLWRIDTGLSLTSGAHYNQIVAADFDGDGKSEVFLKTGDGTTVYGTTGGKFDKNKIISVIGNAADTGKYIIKDKVPGQGHISGGPEYVSFFEGASGRVIDTVPYAFPVGDVSSWGDTFYNRSDRWNAGMAYFDGVHPSAFLGRGYYGRTAYAAYDLSGGRISLRWKFDSDAVNGAGAGMGNHNIAVADIDNDGFDEIIAGSLTLDHDGTIVYTMDGNMNREEGSHGDAIHIGAFYPDVEGLFIWSPREIDRVASLELHDAATGETKMKFFANKDAGRALAANITSQPGWEMWGTGGTKPSQGGGLYNVYDGAEKPVKDSYRDAGLSVNFRLYWNGDLLHELLDGAENEPLSISRYNETTGRTEELKRLDGTRSNNGTKANPCLTADILGDWREEVLVPSLNDEELRIYTTNIPTGYRLYTLMHDPVYRASVAWQNNGYNQPTCLGFYLGSDIAQTVKDGKLPVPAVHYTKK